ncbi:Crp/Fnr family transcriptional regulator [Sulfurimonas lithotrophica]|uniref:Crp/Fnr family transcriptional regulator n=1 Tax=Sulfurimonas lithotrophica TaxID=2590022 RepID=A0A5P8NZ77_9BACT|nr:Crp/Fnr family transcriptional regulator [Sulfurimonas lithotrophica]QFR48726.1 Crp/Fnr family transcriptional regulator [Sulfurimonas lithotrophica]
MSIKEIVKSLSFFSSLNDEDVEKICTISTLHKYTTGYVLHYENQDKDSIEFLVSGLAKAYKIDKHKNEIFLYHLSNDSLLSDINNISSDTLTSFSNLEMAEDSVVLKIDYTEFKQQFLNSRILCSELMNEIIKRSEYMQNIFNREFIFDAVTKVAKMIDDDLDMFNKIKRHDISLILNIQPATLSRVLSRLKRNNIISIEHGKIGIIDKEELKAIYEEVL